MIYNSTSIKEVMGRVVRNTRVADSSYLHSAKEWIPEAMGYMRTRQALQTRWVFIPIEFHKGRLPCGMVGKPAVLDMNGCRMSWYNGQDIVGLPANSITLPARPDPQQSAFLTNIVSRETFEDNITFQSILTQISTMPASRHRYYTEMDYINTDICDGKVLLIYQRIPLDSEGLPLIPDNENYKQALYWYVRAGMIGAGWKDTVFSVTDCEKRFETYAARAIGEIKYPSVDQKQHAVDTLTNLILPVDAWENFFGDITQPVFNDRI